MSDQETICRLYESMVLIRQVEEGLRAEYASRNIRGPIHLSIGQEAVAAGVLGATTADDLCVSTHRNHAHYLAKGGDLQRMIDEMYGLPTGCCGGAGGSMHLFDHTVGMWGASAVLGGSVSLSLGLALARKLANTSALAVAFTGDGGTDEGSFWEALNLAGVLRLPVLFVVEQNQLSTNTFLGVRQAVPDIVTKAVAFGVPSRRVDGNDVQAVHAAATGWIEEIRAEGGPRLLEAHTSRLCAHVGPAISLSSASGPYPDWEQRVAGEPLSSLRARLSPAILTSLPAIEERVKSRVTAAFARAKRAFAEINAVARLEAPPPPDPNRV
jgi:pyruvate dehydrogenase E1 component alpha subunit